MVDIDGDSRTNALEYALNSNPRKAHANSDYTVRIQGGSLVLDYTKIIEATDVDHVVEQSADLVNWSPAKTTNEILADDGRLRTIGAAAPINAASKFLRLSVTLH